MGTTSCASSGSIALPMSSKLLLRLLEVDQANRDVKNGNEGWHATLCLTGRGCNLLSVLSKITHCDE